MPDIEIEPTEEVEKEAAVAEMPSTPLPQSKPASIDSENLTGFSPIKADEKLIEPMELESSEAVPRRRGNFVKNAIKQKASEFKPEIKEGVIVAGEKSKEIMANSGVSFLQHIPGIGLLAGIFSKKQVLAELKNTEEQFTIIHQLRHQNDVSPLLANTLEYAQMQMQKRFRKLKRNSLATNLQLAGAGISLSGILAPLGIGLSAIGTAAKGAQALKSMRTFFTKLYRRTLGIERNTHASLLYGLALEHMQFKNQEAPPRDVDAVNKSLEYVSHFGSIRDREKAREQAYTMLQNLGLINDDFMHSGFKHIRELLKS